MRFFRIFERRQKWAVEGGSFEYVFPNVRMENIRITAFTQTNRQLRIAFAAILLLFLLSCCCYCCCRTRRAVAVVIFPFSDIVILDRL